MVLDPVKVISRYRKRDLGNDIDALMENFQQNYPFLNPKGICLQSHDFFINIIACSYVADRGRDLSSYICDKFIAVLQELVRLCLCVWPM